MHLNKNNYKYYTDYQKKFKKYIFFTPNTLNIIFLIIKSLFLIKKYLKTHKKNKKTPIKIHIM